MKADVLVAIPLRDLAELDLHPRAVFRIHPDDLPDSIEWCEDEDDLDAFRAAALRLQPDEDGRDDWQTTLSFVGWPATGTVIGNDVLHVLLMRYDHEPAGQLTLFLAGQLQLAGEVERSVARVAAALGWPATATTTLEHRSEASLS